MRSTVRLPHVVSEFGLQTASLFLLDGLANVTDFAFHFWLGRALVPPDFATLQTLNAILLVCTTANGVFQPVVGRFVAEARGRGQESSISAIFQSFFRAAFWIGSVLAFLILLFSSGIGQLFNLPAWTIQISAALIFLSILRPVAIGVLQGREQFLPFGYSRFGTALGRLSFAAIFIYFGFALRGAIAAFPVGWLAGLVIALAFLGSSVWKRNEPAPPGLLRQGWNLSVYALAAYLIFMSLMSIDLVWVNRSLPGQLAGSYAGLVLLRRVVALLPGVVVVVMFPRVAKRLAGGKLPDRLLLQTALIILMVSGLLTLLYFVFDRQIISILFGDSYLSASSLLGWMGFSMIGVSLSSLWLNFYLAYKPRDFVVLLGLALLLEWTLLNLPPPSTQGAVFAFGLAGWLLSIGGLLLYLFKHRKGILHA